MITNKVISQSKNPDTLAHRNRPVNLVQPITRSTNELEKRVETNRSCKKSFVADLRENGHGQRLGETLIKHQYKKGGIEKQIQNQESKSLMRTKGSTPERLSSCWLGEEEGLRERERELKANNL